MNKACLSKSRYTRKILCIYSKLIVLNQVTVMTNDIMTLHTHGNQQVGRESIDSWQREFHKCRGRIGNNRHVHNYTCYRVHIVQGCVVILYCESKPEQSLNSEMRARVIGVHTQMLMFDFCMGSLLIHHSDNLGAYSMNPCQLLMGNT